MKIVSYPAFHKDGRLREFKDILGGINGQGLFWTILEFDGAGDPPNGQSCDEFHSMTLESGNGLLCTWDFVINLSDRFVQIYNCMLVGSKKRLKNPRLLVRNENYDEINISIECVDSSYWVIKKHNLF